jgi:hypothetical protein
VIQVSRRKTTCVPTLVEMAGTMLELIAKSVTPSVELVQEQAQIA